MNNNAKHQDNNVSNANTGKEISNKQESLELQNTIIKLKKSLESFKSRHGNVEARISDLQSKTLEITREAKRKKKKK